MAKSLLPLILFSLLSHASLTQGIKSDSVYITRGGSTAQDLSKATFLRVTTRLSSTTLLVKEYYLGGELYREYEDNFRIENFGEGEEKEAREVKYQKGIITAFYPNGNKLYQGPYQNWRPNGIISYWYKNGQLKGEFEKDSRLYQFPPEGKVKSYYDSTGRQWVTEGQGVFFHYDDEGLMLDSGNIKDGRKDGLWFGHFGNGSFYTEVWKDGQIMNGQSFDSTGKSYSYDSLLVNPIYGVREDLEMFYDYLGKNIKYPAPQRRMGIEGRVFVSFYIDKEGNVQDVYVVKGIESTLDAEAARVIAEAPKFTPGMVRGQKANISLTVPILFRLH